MLYEHDKLGTEWLTSALNNGRSSFYPKGCFRIKAREFRARQMGSKEGMHGQAGTTTALRAADGYGQAEHRLMCYDWAAKEGRLAITHNKRAFQIPERDQFESKLDRGLNMSSSFV
jgi:hypothetical protein